MNRRVAVGVFALALVVRLLHVWQIRGAPFFDLMLGDAESYDAWARRLAAGDWLGSEVFYQAPLYPYFLGTLYTLFGDGKVTVLFFQAVVGAAASVLLAFATARFLAPRSDAAAAGVAAGLMLAFYAPAIFFDGLIQKSVLDLFFLCLLLWLLSRIVDHVEPPGASWVWLGVALGALVLTRENALVFVAVLLPWMLLRPAVMPEARKLGTVSEEGSHRKASKGGKRSSKKGKQIEADRRAMPSPTGRQRLVPVALFLCGLAMALLPVALRNLAVGGEFHLTTSQFGPNFYIGNHQHASGVYEPLRPGRGSFEYERLDATEIAERASGRDLGPKEVSHYWARRAFADITAEPGRWLRLVARKLRLATNAVEIVDTEDLYTYQDHSVVLRLTSAALHFGTLAPLALLGVWVTWEQRQRLWLLYLLPAGYLASVLVFYVVARYRYPLVPFLFPLAAAGAVALPGLLRRRPGSQCVGIAVAVFVLAIFCNWPAVAKDRMRAVTELNVGETFESRGDLVAAERHFRRAAELDTESSMAQFNLGTLLQSRGDLEAAAGHFGRALEIRPDHVGARVNLGVALASQGEIDAAVGQFERALEVDSGDPGAHTNLALALQSRGDLEGAAGHLRQALATDPDHVPAHESLGNILVAKGMLDEGIEQYLEVLRLDPDHPEVHGYLGLVYQSMGDLEGAVRHLTETVDLEPDNALAHNRLGNALLAAGDLDGAIRHYRRVTELRPSNMHGHANLGMALGEAGRGEEAVAHLQEARRLEEQARRREP